MIFSKLFAKHQFNFTGNKIRLIDASNNADKIMNEAFCDAGVCSNSDLQI